MTAWDDFSLALLTALGVPNPGAACGFTYDHNVGDMPTLAVRYNVINPDGSGLIFSTVRFVPEVAL